MSKLSPSDRGMLLGFLTVLAGFAGFWPIDWFRQDHSHWPLGWWEFAREHPRIVTDAAVTLCLLIALSGILLIRAVYRASQRRHRRELARRPLYDPKGHVRIKRSADGVVTPFRRSGHAG